MPTAEGQWQIRIAQTDQGGLILRVNAIPKCLNSKLIGQRGEKLSALFRQRLIVGAHIRQEIGFGYTILIDKCAATHHVKQDIGEMVLRAQTVAGNLHPIRAADDTLQLFVAGPDIARNCVIQGGVGAQLLPEVCDRRTILIDFRNDMPGML